MVKRHIKEERVEVVREKQNVSFDVEFQSFHKENAITGEEGRFLLYQLKQNILEAKQIDIIVSFLMESGVRLLIRDLKEAVKRGVPIRILTGNYLNITQPSALYLLKKEFGDSIDIRFYRNPRKSFHTKAYIFQGNQGGEMFIGSSNISHGALTDSVEWNYRLKEREHPDDFAYFYKTFERLFYEESIPITDEVLYEYSKSWKKPVLSKQIPLYEEDQEQEVSNHKGIQPRGAQIEALYQLKCTREQGYDRGIVVAATGIGKTYLAAFDSISYENILFVAHREEILMQAMESFENVRGTIDAGFFYGEKKETGRKITFALVQTLGKEKYLNEEYFSKDYFDYVIVDEFHHAVAKNYQNIISYFEPKFLLGLTATPERMDSGDVYAVCNDNLVYELRLKEAVNKGWLVPFRYYGIYDDTVDYEKITYQAGRYNEKELEEAYRLSRRADLILQNYNKYRSRQALGFCSSRAHAYQMAQYFSEHDVPAVAVFSSDDEYRLEHSNSKPYYADRKQAINRLRNGEIRVIFSVDMFNEGVDIKSVDLLLFLRPTQSSTVFLQQLGRGLRRCEGKKYVTVLDFIGNYKNANRIPFFLCGEAYDSRTSAQRVVDDYSFPEDCFVDFDFKLIDLFKIQARQTLTVRQKIDEEFDRLKSVLNHRPTRTEYVTKIGEEEFSTLYRNSNYNPLRDYLEYLRRRNELTEEEKLLMDGDMHHFIRMIETTSMEKSYKIPVLLAFYNNGNLKASITAEDVYKSFSRYYKKGANRVDMLRDSNTATFEQWEQKEYVRLARSMPIYYMQKSHGDIFVKEDTDENILLSIRPEYVAYFDNETFCQHVGDAIEARGLAYYRRRHK